jgi:hypothetical protein
MQVVMRWSEGVVEYIQQFKTIRAEAPKRCETCGCNKFYRWGKYERNVIEGHAEHRVPVRRMRCAKCRRTVSFLPDFCISRVQYSASVVFWWLSWALGGSGGGAAAPTPKPPSAHESLRRRAYAFRQRFVSRENLWLVFLRERELREVSSSKKGRVRDIFRHIFALWQAGQLFYEFYRDTRRHFMAR